MSGQTKRCPEPNKSPVESDWPIPRERFWHGFRVTSVRYVRQRLLPPQALASSENCMTSHPSILRIVRPHPNAAVCLILRIRGVLFGVMLLASLGQSVQEEACADEPKPGPSEIVQEVQFLTNTASPLPMPLSRSSIFVNRSCCGRASDRA